MADPKQDKKRDDVLKRMLETPPDPHKSKKNKDIPKPKHNKAQDS